VSTSLYDSITRIARHESHARPIAGVGRVVDAFPSTEGAAPTDHAVSIEMRDSGLVLPRVPVAVGVMGFATIPAVDDLVVVVFLEGDFNAPVVVGRLYHADHDPPTHGDGELVLRMPSGESDPKLNFVVKGEEPSICLELPGDVRLEIVEAKVMIQVGEMHVSVEGSGGGRAELAAGGSTITLKKDGDVSVSAAGKLTLEGTEVEVAGQSSVKVTGAQVEIN
jgi:uncharacterized protein involved in type VI secretion and phage assembly